MWVDDCIVAGRKQDVKDSIRLVKKYFKISEIGELTEFLGCQIVRNSKQNSMKITQPVLLQSFLDEFDIPKSGSWKTPAVPGEVLIRGDSQDIFDKSEQRIYRSGVGKMLHMCKYSRPEIINSVRELSRFMDGAVLAQKKAMYQVMRYLTNTPGRGLFMKPKHQYAGKDFEFEILGVSDSEYGKNPETRKSVSGTATFLNGMPVTWKSKMQGCVTLSSTEAEYVAASQEAQEMMFVMRVLLSIGLKVYLPMKLKVDNTGAIDLANKRTTGVRTRHVDIRHHYIRDLKEQGFIELEWVSTDDNETDIFTKNCAQRIHEKHTHKYCGDDEYYQY